MLNNFKILPFYLNVVHFAASADAIFAKGAKIEVDCG